MDRDACIAFIRASAAASSSVTRFLLVSYIQSRSSPPNWWSASSWVYAQSTQGSLSRYHAAKLAADQALFEIARDDKIKGKWTALDLRPGTLADEELEGPVELGRTKESKGKVGRKTVASVVDALLASEGFRTCALDLLGGGEGVEDAVERALKERVTSFDGISEGLR